MAGGQMLELISKIGNECVKVKQREGGEGKKGNASKQAVTPYMPLLDRADCRTGGGPEGKPAVALVRVASLWTM